MAIEIYMFMNGNILNVNDHHVSDTGYKSVDELLESKDVEYTREEPGDLPIPEEYSSSLDVLMRT